MQHQLRSKSRRCGGPQHFRAQRSGVIACCLVIKQPTIELLTILMRHDRNDVLTTRLINQRHQTTKLAVVCPLDRHAGVRGAFGDQPADLGHTPTPQVLTLIDDLNDIGTQCSDLAEAYEDLIAPITSGTDAQ